MGRYRQRSGLPELLSRVVFPASPHDLGLRPPSKGRLRLRRDRDEGRDRALSRRYRAHLSNVERVEDGRLAPVQVDVSDTLRPDRHGGQASARGFVRHVRREHHERLSSFTISGAERTTDIWVVSQFSFPPTAQLNSFEAAARIAQRFNAPRRWRA
jgi:hypothetical protein